MKRISFLLAPGSRRVLGGLFLGLGFAIGGLLTATASAQQAEPAPIKAGPVEFGGNLRVRYENWGWFDVPGRDSRHDFLGTLLRFTIKGKHALDKRNSLDWQAETSFASVIGLPRNAVAPAPAGALGFGGTIAAANGDRRTEIFLKQAFLRWRFTHKDRTLSLRVGRFEYSDGLELGSSNPTVNTLKRQRIAERLLGPFGFTIAQRSFDGVHVSYGNATKNVTVVGVRPVEGVFQLDGLRQVPSVSVVYGSYAQALHPFQTPDKKTQYLGEFRLFALHYRDGRNVLKIDNRPLAVRRADTESINLTTFGGNYLRTFNAGKGKFDVLAWGAGQFGRWGNQDHRAGAFAVEGGYQFDAKWQPWLRIGHFRSSGDGNPNDNRHTTFFQVLPTPRIYARTPFFNLMNNVDSFVSLTVKPTPKMTIRADGHRLTLANRNDLWYLGGGAFQRGTFGYVGRPSSGLDNLGGLVDVSFDYQVNSRISVNAYVSRMIGRGPISRIYPTGSNGHFALVELVFRF